MIAPLKSLFVASFTALFVGLSPGAQAQTWTADASFSAGPRVDMAGIQYQGRLMAVGGLPHAAPNFEDSPVQEFFIGGTSWNSLTTLDGPQDRCGVGEDALGRLIVFGGIDATDPEGDVGKAYVYDLVEGKKGSIAQRNSGAPDDRFMYVTDASHRIYSIGGGPGFSASSGNPNSAHVERYDGNADAWTTLAPLPMGVADGAAVLDAQGDIVVVGGYGTSGAYLTNAFVFDVAAGTWDSAAIPPLPVATADLSLALGADDRLYAIGGRTAAGLTDKVWSLDAQRTAWTPGPSLPSPRASHVALLASNDEIYLLGGTDGLGGTTEVLRLFTPECAYFPNLDTAPRKVYQGMTLGLALDVLGGAPMTFQWARDNVPLLDGLTGNGSVVAGATTASLAIQNAQLADAGSYTLSVTNGCGVSVTPALVVTVAEPPSLVGTWTLEVLDSGSQSSAAEAVGDVGNELFAGGNTSYVHSQYGTQPKPHLWSLDTAAQSDLTPPNSVGGKVYALENGTAAGWYWWPYTVPAGTGYYQHACVWDATTGAYTDIQPSGWEIGSIGDTDGTHHVGNVRFDETDQHSHGAYWNSSVKSASTLTPSGAWGSSVSVLEGDYQYGSIVWPFAVVKAARWKNGVASSYVEFIPSGATTSAFIDGDEGLVGGYSRFGGDNHAGVWSGGADSFVDLTPAGATGSSLIAMHGGLQLGSVSYPGQVTPVIWRSSPDDTFDLSTLNYGTLNTPSFRDIQVRPDGVIEIIGTAYDPAAGLTRAVRLRMSPETLTSDVDSLSMAQGGTQTLSLEVGPDYAGKFYLIVGSLSGTTPGTPVDAVTLPLNMDNYLLFSLNHANSSYYQTTLGPLSVQGQASAQLVLPPNALPSLIGTTLHHAGLVLDVSAGVQAVFATNAVPLTLVP